MIFRLMAELAKILIEEQLHFMVDMVLLEEGIKIIENLTYCHMNSDR